MQTISKEEYEKLYGTQGVKALAEMQPKQNRAVQDLKNAFKGGVDQFRQGVSQAKSATNPLQTLEAGLQEGAGIVGAAFSPLAPVTKYVGQGINAVADKVSNSKGVQDFAMSPAGGATARVAQDVSNISQLLSLRDLGVGGEGISAVSKATARGVKDSAANVGARANASLDSVGRAAKDIVPTSQGVINHQVTKALDLSPGDLNKITRSTGNDVGGWLADNNLIGENKAETQANIKNFTDQNYSDVRTHIGNVDKAYDSVNVPRYTDALKAIGKKVDDVPGLEQVSSEVKNLLEKKQVGLSDVQRVKELLDSHFNLYKMTGDVAEGAAKEGLANMRGDLRSFIEKEVEDHSGQDIRQMNNHVATGKTLGDAIETRAPKGLTQANLKLGDLGIFGVGMSFGGPLGGAALLFGKKLMETPTVRLRVAKYLDGVSDVKKAKIQADLEAGKIPAEFDQFIKKR